MQYATNKKNNLTSCSRFEPQTSELRAWFRRFDLLNHELSKAVENPVEGVTSNNFYNLYFYYPSVVYTFYLHKISSRCTGYL